MTDIHKFLSEIEDAVYSSINKQEGDSLIEGYEKLFNIIKFEDYKLSLQKDLKIAIKHKAYSKKILLWFANNDYFINNKKIELHSINEKLPTYFNLDKNKEAI